ncbi:MAG: hypothetical protein Kow0054_19310 [Deferrisoma sp.]
MDEIGIGGERVRMYNLSSAQAQRFAEICTEMTEHVRALGPNPLKGAEPPAARPAEAPEAEVRA